MPRLSLTTLLTCLTLSAQVFYLSPNGSDANDGTTPNRPIKTFARANAVLAAGATLYLRGGTYTRETTDFFAIEKSGTVAAPILIAAYEQELPIFASPSSYQLHLLVSGSYVTVSGLNFLNTDATVAVDLRGEYITVKNCRFANIAGTGIRLLGAKHVTIINNVIDGTGSPAGFGTAASIDVIDSTDVTILSNWFWRAGHAAIDIINSSNIRVDRNYFDLQWAGGIYLIRGASRSLIQNNVIRRTGYLSFEVTKNAIQIAGQFNTVRNNTIVDTKRAPFPDDAISLQSYQFAGPNIATDNSVSHNLVTDVGGASLLINNKQDLPLTRNRIFNNMFLSSKRAGNQWPSYWAPGNPYILVDTWWSPNAQWSTFPNNNRIYNNLVLHDNKGVPSYDEGRLIVYSDRLGQAGFTLTQANNKFPRDIFDNIEMLPTFLARDEMDFYPASSSLAIDRGGPTGEVVQLGVAATQSTTAKVDNPAGFWAGDAIYVNATSAVVVSSSQDTGWITFDKAIAIRVGDKIWLGSEKPDVGPLEFASPRSHISTTINSSVYNDLHTGTAVMSLSARFPATDPIKSLELLIGSPEPHRAYCLIDVWTDSGIVRLSNPRNDPSRVSVVAGRIGESRQLTLEDCHVNLAQVSLAVSQDEMRLVMNASTAWTPAPLEIYAAAVSQSYQALPSRLIGIFTGALRPVAPPRIVTASPSSSAGTQASFSVVVEEPTGVNNIRLVSIVVDQWVKGNNGCVANVLVQSGTLSLLNDSGTTWSAGTIGSALKLFNGQCELNLRSSRIEIVSRTQIKVTVETKFAAAFSGPKSMFSSANNISLLDSGFVKGEPFLVIESLPTGPPVLSGLYIQATGMRSDFVIYVGDTSGIANIRTVGLVIADWVKGVDSCVINTSVNGRSVALLDDNGIVWRTGSLGSQTVLRNSRCSVSLALAKLVLSDTVTISLTVEFAPAYVGTKKAFVTATNSALLSTGFREYGPVQIQQPQPPLPTAPPRLLSLEPTAGEGRQARFRVVVEEVSGASRVRLLSLRVDAWIKSTQSCVINVYLQGGDTVSLLSNDGLLWSSGWVDSSAVLQNSQCRVVARDVIVTRNDNVLTIDIPIMFSVAFNGLKSVFANANNTGLLDTGIRTMGSFRVN